MIVGVSNENEEKLSSYIDSKGVEFGIIRSTQGGDDYGVRAYPTFITIGPSGDVVHGNGVPDAQVIETHLADVDLVPAMPDTATFSGIRRAWKKRDFKRLDRELTDALAEIQAGNEDHAALTDLRMEFVRMLEAANKRIERLAAGPNYLKSETQLKRIVKDFDGLAPADAAEEVLDRFKRDDSIKKEIKASKALQATLSKYDASSISQRKKLLKALTGLAKRFSGTYAAQQATKTKMELASRR